MYEFLSGPMLWLTFIIFLFGLSAKIISTITLSRSKDRIFYNHVHLGWGLKSILMWLIPLGSVSMRSQPVFSLAGFLFHFSLLSVPIFLNAHNILWDESFGVSLWSIPDFISDILTILCIISGIFLFLRRLIRPEVRILTEPKDFIFLLFTLLPFITGFLAYHQWGNYEIMMNLHILTAEILLILIPFTKLSHMILFFFTRIFIGFEMGGRRGAKTW
jgi:nitrate reductase gamma subunit